MRNRRDFLKEAVGSAVLAGSQAAGASGLLGFHPPVQTDSVVIVARDPGVHDDFKQPIPRRVQALLDRAIASYTGQTNAVAAWRSILGGAKTVGLKVNGLAGRGICSHASLVWAIAQRVQEAGIAPGKIVVWDRNGRDLQSCGLSIQTNKQRVRCFGSDVSGYEEQEESWGTVRVRLSKILTRECDLVIGVPILKDHSMAGVTFAMKNMYGVIEKPQDLHGTGCCPAVADLNCIPAIRHKVRFTIGDAMTAQYDGGPEYQPGKIWYSNALIVGADRVAVDHVAWQMIDRKRAEAGLKSLEEEGRAPRYLAVAADAQHGLGTHDPSRYQLREI